MSATSPPPAPAPRARHRGLRMALLGLFGVLAVVLPLSQVLRFQTDALAELQAERARLDPLAEAVAVQRGLIGHDEVATRVLRGRTALEDERRLRQAVVDRHLAALRASLPTGTWLRARREADSLHDGWVRLVDDVRARRIGADASRAGHRLLQEQAVQVMDLVQARAPLPPGQAAPVRDAAQLEARRSELDRQARRVHATRDLAALALASVLALAALGAWRARNGHTPAPAPDGGAVRRSHGRRAQDRPGTPAPAELAQAELQAVRQNLEDLRNDR